jgi:hypothetical protein
MAKMYQVQPGNRLTGKHRVYNEGEYMPESELCGDWRGSIKDGVIKEVGPAAALAAQPAQKPAEKPADTESTEPSGGPPEPSRTETPPHSIGSGARKKGGAR